MSLIGPIFSGSPIPRLRGEYMEGLRVSQGGDKLLPLPQSDVTATSTGQ